MQPGETPPPPDRPAGAVQPAALPSVLPRLTALRAFAALFVLTDHLALFGVIRHGELPFSIGFTAVSFFFVLSGFVLAWSSTGTTARAFYLRRFARIYPAYLVVFFIALVVPVSPGQGATTPKTALATAVLLQGWALHSPNLAFAVNGPFWSLSCEAAFYAAFPLLVVVLLRMPPRWRWSATIAWWLLCSAVIAFGAHEGASWYPVDYANPLLRSAEFVLGVTAALELRKGRSLPSWAGVSIALGSLAALVAVPKSLPTPDIAATPLFFVVVVWCARRDVEGCASWLHWRPLLYCGEVSYCFYLVNELVIVNLKPAVGTNVSAAALMGLVAAAGAMLIHHVIELPCQRWILGRRALYPLRAFR